MGNALLSAFSVPRRGSLQDAEIVGQVGKGAVSERAGGDHSASLLDVLMTHSQHSIN